MKQSTDEKKGYTKHMVLKTLSDHIIYNGALQQFLEHVFAVSSVRNSIIMITGVHLCHVRTQEDFSAFALGQWVCVIV